MDKEVRHREKNNGSAGRSLSLWLLPVVLFVAVVAAVASSAPAPVVPEIPAQNRMNSDKVFLERADRLFTQRGDSFQILVGDVIFRRQGMFMYCDSAHFYPDNSMKAYGNVRMEQGDTLFVYADSLWYDDVNQLATLYAWPGKKVKLINNEVMLETDEFYYDMAIELGYYDVGGTLTDSHNRLTSLMGEYSPSTKDASFYTDVNLTSIRDSGDTLTILTDTLLYNTDTHVALLTTYSTIINKDGTIFTTAGNYNTETDLGELYDRSLVVMKRGNTLTGDTLFYDNKAGYGEAFGNMILTDSVRQTTLMGDYGFYNELTDSIFVTGRALAMEYSRPDTLYLHGDTIRGFKVYLPEEQINDTLFMAEDSTHYLIVEPKVRFYRVDLQGICDSMTFIQIDSTMYMDKHPVVWSENRQIFGNEIQVHLNDSTVDRITLPDNGFSAEIIEEGYYNQLAGREMIAYLDNGELRHLDVNGNVQAISFPMENDSTYNKVISMESSYLAADFKDQTLDRMKVWPAVKSVVTPLYLAKKKILGLPQLRWLEILRPIDAEDVFNVSQEMIDYMNEPLEQGTRGKEMKKPAKKELLPGRRAVIKPLPFELRDSIIYRLDSITGDTIAVDTVQYKVTLPRETPAKLEMLKQDSLRADSIPPDTFSIAAESINITVGSLGMTTDSIISDAPENVPDVPGDSSDSLPVDSEQKNDPVPDNSQPYGVIPEKSETVKNEELPEDDYPSK